MYNGDNQLSISIVVKSINDFIFQTRYQCWNYSFIAKFNLEFRWFDKFYWLSRLWAREFISFKQLFYVFTLWNTKTGKINDKVKWNLILWSFWCLEVSTSNIMKLYRKATTTVSMFYKQEQIGVIFWFYQNIELHIDKSFLKLELQMQIPI